MIRIISKTYLVALLLVVGCASKLDRTIDLSEETTAPLVRDGEIIVVHLSNAALLEPSKIERIPMIVIDSNDSAIMGQVLSDGSVCYDLKLKSSDCRAVKEVDGEAVQVNIDSIDRIDVMKVNTGDELKTPDYPNPPSTGEGIFRGLLEVLAEIGRTL